MTRRSPSFSCVWSVALRSSVLHLPVRDTPHEASFNLTHFSQWPLSPPLHRPLRQAQAWCVSPPTLACLGPARSHARPLPSDSLNLSGSQRYVAPCHRGAPLLIRFLACRSATWCSCSKRIRARFGC